MWGGGKNREKDQSVDAISPLNPGEQWVEMGGGFSKRTV